ncbi:MAG: family 43 glycosylhydrolase [Bacteroidales bacterium]|nr:family 43 glycosylhydrolase [Bacteroidales bacterium]
MKPLRLLTVLVLAGTLAAGLSVHAQTRHTFANPLDVLVGNERSIRGGEPVVLIHQDDYYLFVSHRRGYWYSPDFQNWTYVDAPNYPAGVVSVVEFKGELIGCSMNNKNVYKAVDPKKGVWEKIGELSSDRYGDANLFADDDGRLYLYFGWSQIMPIQVVELDTTTFKEKSAPRALFFSDIKNHGFEVRKPEDVIYSIFNGRREYNPEELPWIEGPWMTKYKGKYYLQYAAIGLEFISYSHGIYVSDNPMGPFTYSEHNPLTFKTSGFQVGAGHGSTFFDKKGNLWTICMIPAHYGETGRGSELAIYPAAIDQDGVMYADTGYGDYPQYYPADRKVGGADNYTGWKLLSYKKRTEVSSTFGNYLPVNALDEDFLTCWAAATGDPGEYFMVDLGDIATIHAIQLNWDHIGAEMAPMGGFGAPAAQPGPDTRYQCYEVAVSSNGTSWTTIISKPENNLELKHDYNEFEKPVNARYVKVTNVATYDRAKFSIKDLRVFGTTAKAKTTKVTDVKVVRNPLDRREADLLWSPVPGADGYVVRYGIAPEKLYNSYIVYGKNSLYMHSLNTGPEYWFEVEAFDSGLDSYRENTLATLGSGAEIQIAKRGAGPGGMSGYRQAADTKIQMLKDGVDEYVFEDIDPGTWVLNHTLGPVLWSGELTEKELISNAANPQPTLTATLTLMGAGTTVTNTLVMRVIPGKEKGKIVVSRE